MSLAPASFPGPLSLPNPAQTQEPGITTAFSKPTYKDLYGKIYRKIIQIREIDEYRRFAILVLRLQPLKQQSGSQNGIDELLKTDARHHFIDRPICTFRYQLVPAPAQLAVFDTHISHLLIDFQAKGRLLEDQVLGFLCGKEILVTNFNFLLRISIHSKEKRLLGYLNDRLQ